MINLYIFYHIENWKGLTCCDIGYECQKIDHWYSECMKVSNDIIRDNEESDDDNDAIEINTNEVSIENKDSDDESINPSVLWVIGDSTLCEFEEIYNNYYYKKYGYGTQLYHYFDKNIIVKNLAISGTSSKSFILEQSYHELIKNMKAGDYLTFGFGHNDEKREEERYTNPNGDYKTMGSFANSIYENYIKIAMERNVSIILTTPIVRRTDKSTWSSDKLHITKTKDGYEGGDYPQAIRDLGKTLNIPVIDMTVKTKELYDTFGYNNTLYLHAWKINDSSSVDNTHLNLWGSKYVAYLFTRDIKQASIDGLSEYVIDAPIPTKEENFIKNPTYNVTLIN
ncbi:SGNH hydrolase [Piromyces finnis]|uniref:SGNH hydrolase n=1 Tax=Piromyces finnis TaxID=1754191 RepID=A0A1Y1UY90_9FUNG|nr:SGNH hydrolase [Piromyces finnis]ORX49577.1 SGNH hydrolase [Piromyces finnis]|eukprot:ORX42222.1 SGNH hydrolase [Piromyces finnis]